MAPHAAGAAGGPHSVIMQLLMYTSALAAAVAWAVAHAVPVSREPPFHGKKWRARGSKRLAGVRKIMSSISR